MTRASFAATLLLLPLAACDNPFASDDEGDVRLIADAARYVAGETIELRLVNRTDDTIVYDLCSPDIDILFDDDWIETEYAPVLPCMAMVYVLPPGRSATGFVPLAAGMPDGTYRVRTEVRDGAELAREVATWPFHVQSRIHPQ